MDLSRDFIKAKRPCTDGFRWFLRTHREGGDYQPLLDALVSEGRINDACWLLDQFGPTDAVLHLDNLEATAIVFAGSIEVRGNIEVDTLVRAGRNIVAGGGVRSGGSIVTGEDLRVDGNIRCAEALDVRGDVRTGWGIEVDGTIRCGGDLRVEWDLHCRGQLDVDGKMHIGLFLI